jgi:hypothetical protein
METNWVFQEPVDFEHKQYILLGYLQKIEKELNDFKLYPNFQLLSLHLANINLVLQKIDEIYKTDGVCKGEIKSICWYVLTFPGRINYNLFGWYWIDNEWFIRTVKSKVYSFIRDIGNRNCIRLISEAVYILKSDKICIDRKNINTVISLLCTCGVYIKDIHQVCYFMGAACCVGNCRRKLSCTYSLAWEQTSGYIACQDKWRICNTVIGFLQLNSCKRIAFYSGSDLGNIIWWYWCNFKCDFLPGSNILLPQSIGNSRCTRDRDIIFQPSVCWCSLGFIEAIIISNEYFINKTMLMEHSLFVIFFSLFLGILCVCMV